jgi:hypothetical protein
VNKTLTLFQKNVRKRADKKKRLTATAMSNDALPVKSHVRRLDLDATNDAAIDQTLPALMSNAPDSLVVANRSTTTQNVPNQRCMTNEGTPISMPTVARRCVDSQLYYLLQEEGVFENVKCECR